MKRKILAAALLAGTALAGLSPAFAGQAPYGASAPNIPVNSHHRVYAGDRYSNTFPQFHLDSRTYGQHGPWHHPAW